MKMKYQRLLLLIFLAVSCGKESEPVPTPTDTIKITSDSAFTLPSDGGTITVRFTSGGDWMASLSNDRAAGWLSLSEKSGPKGNASLVLTAAKSDEAEERSATVRLTCGKASATVTVTQKQKDALTQTPSKTEFGAEGGTFSIEVRSNIDYTFEIEGSEWIHMVTTKAMTEKTTTFTVDANTDTRKREGSVTVVSSLGKEKTAIFQAAGSPSIVLTSNQIAIKAEGEAFIVEISTNVDVEMSITAGAEWIRETPTKASSTHTYSFVASANENTDPRVGEITFSNSQYGLSEKVTVTQMQKNALVVAPAAIEIGAEGGSFPLEATTNVDLEVKIAHNWIRQAETKALHTETLTFTVDANDTYDDRENTITISGGGLSQTVTVKQDAASGFIADFKEQYSISARSQTLELPYRANVDVEAQSRASWITVVSTKGLSSNTLTLQIAENTGEEPRTGKVTLSALGIVKEATILQVGAGDVYIPDDTFRSLMLSLADKNADGVLSKEECEAIENIRLDAVETPSVHQIESIQGIEYFTNVTDLYLRGMNSAGALGKLSGTIDLSANVNLWNASLDGYDKVEVLDIHTCTNLRSLSLVNFGSLKKVIFPEADGLFLVSIYMPGTKIGPELDLSNYPDLAYIYLNNNPGLKTLWLTTGLVPSYLDLDPGCTISYKGDNPNVEAPFKDPVFKEMMLNSAFFKSYDWDGDGTFSYRELERIPSISLWPEDFDGMDPGKVITTFEDIAMFKSLKTFAMSDLYGRINAPLPECLGDLPDVDRILIDDCNFTGTIPESICKMEKLVYLTLDKLQITGPLPSGIGSIPNLTDLVITGCPNIGGPIPESLLDGCRYSYINLSGCNFDDTFIVVPSSRLLDHTAQDNNFSYIGSEAREYTLPGGGVYYEYPNVYYRSDADGHGAIHADGEAELYHAATKGPGLDIFLTGDGFTAENNTVGGTLETYLKHLAEVTLSMEPYNKLAEYFNIWLVYAHSEREGTGIQSADGLKFGSYQPNPGGSSTCIGNHANVISFVQEATGRHEPSGTVAVIMNSSHYGGTCYYTGGVSMYSAGLAVGYTPSAWMMDLTYVHETLGHGFGHLDDEYEAAGQSSSYSYMATYWPSAGFGANMDANEDVRWSPYITDARYSAENIGAYATQKRISTYFGSGYQTYYRPTVNSIMKTQWDEGGNRFNAPSREAIWQRVHILSHPEENWSSWEDYVNSGYNREEFVSFDLSPAPSSARSRPLRQMRNPERTLPDGRKVGQLPPPTPPVFLNLPER
ncbi:MAG: hypothetical protein IJ813_05470 [Bacteroidales bacterium]|nr:hypothetical protein [Bacteroidales bacterium]